MTRASILVIDPPWRFNSNSDQRPGRNARRHYPTMTDEEIAALPVAEWTAPDALMFLWTTAPIMERAMAIVRSGGWGRWRYVSMMVWVKERTGTGFWVRNRHEPVLIYRRGRFPCPRPAPFADSVIAGQQREHSRKPDALQARIDAVWSDAVRMEAFARTARPGWIVWGNETDRFPAEAA